ncbi:MAG: 30S ribosomal protein S5 [Patescibacteria group bacterium]|nr:30S ribosomal protein S5 [Patescibacteria group bacterium]
MERHIRIKSEYKEKVLDLRRVTRVVAGGKRMSFRATVVVGDEKGKVGLGVSKGLDVAQAVDKAKTKAKKNIVHIILKGRTIPHEVRAKYSAASVLIKPAKLGHGLKAGGAVRNILLLCGIKDATAKTLGATKNKLTTAMAALNALKSIKSTPVMEKTKHEKISEKEKEKENQ